MDKKLWLPAIMIVVLVSLVAGLIINSRSELRRQQSCAEARIRPFPEDFFVWTGIVKLNQEGKFQPKCL